MVQSKEEIAANAAKMRAYRAKPKVKAKEKARRKAKAQIKEQYEKDYDSFRYEISYPDSPDRKPDIMTPREIEMWGVYYEHDYTWQYMTPGETLRTSFKHGTPIIMKLLKTPACRECKGTGDGVYGKCKDSCYDCEGTGNAQLITLVNKLDL
jgi:hypothetical protein